MDPRQDILRHMMEPYCWISSFLYFWIVLFLAWPPVANASENPLPEMDPQGFPAMGKGCLATGKCHAGIEPIRAHNSRMAEEIYRKGKILGDPNGCVVCHGGNSREEKDPALAHQGAPAGNKLQVFTRHAASMWVMTKLAASAMKSGSMPETGL